MKPKYVVRAQQRPYIIVRPDGWREATWEAVDEILELFPIVPNPHGYPDGVSVQYGAEVWRIYPAKQQVKYDVPISDGTYPDEDYGLEAFKIIREDQQ